MNTETLNAGETWVREVSVYSDRNRTPQVLTVDADVTLEVFDSPGGQSVLTGVAEVTNAEDGKVRVSLTSATDMPFSVLYWVVTLKDADYVAVIDSGKLTISGSVSS